MIRQLQTSALFFYGIATATACAQDDAREGDVTVEYIAHASFRIQSDDGTTVLIDPFASSVWIGYDFPSTATANIDAVLITHPHYDHDGGRYRELPVPWEDGMRILDSSGTFTVNEISAIGVKGKHADPYGMEFGQLNTIWLLRIDELRIAHIGDNGPLTQQNIDQFGRVDVLMMPIDAEYHILSEVEIQDILMAVKPSFLIPMHYRHPDLEDDGKPEGLGPIEPWVADKADVVRLDSNSWTVNVRDLPDEPQIIVFQHATNVSGQ